MLRHVVPAGPKGRACHSTATDSHTSSRRRRRVVGKAAAVEPSVWDDIVRQAGQNVLEGFTVRNAAKPGTVPSTTIPTQEHPNSDKRVLLYRDTNGWCPFCQRVWMVLIEKNIEFDTMLINLRDKPEWYENVATNTQTPAMRLDGDYMCESLDIMAALEEKFPEHKLAPQDIDEYTALLERFSRVSGTLFRIVFGPMPEPDPLEELRSTLQYMEEVAAKHEGLYVFGEFSMADAALAPFLPLLLHVRQGLRTHEYPHLENAVRAVTERPSFQQTAVDFGTRQMIANRLFNMPRSQGNVEGVSEPEMRARREAAAKVAANRDAIVQTIMHGSGTTRASGIVVQQRQADSHEVIPQEAQRATAVEHALQRLCVLLVNGEQSKPNENSEETAIQVATWAYLRNLAASPRDMSLPAVVQFRLACDTLIQNAYVFP